MLSPLLSRRLCTSSHCCQPWGRRWAPAARAPWELGGLGQRGGNAGSPGGKLQKQKQSAEKGVQNTVGNVAGQGGGRRARGTPSLRAKQRPAPTSCACYAKGFRLDATGEEPVSSEQEPGAPAPSSAAPARVLGEEVSRETAGPHLRG